MTKQEVYILIALLAVAFKDNKEDTYEEMNPDVLSEFKEYLNVHEENMENAVDTLDNDPNSEEFLKLILKFIKNSHKLVDE